MREDDHSTLRAWGIILIVLVALLLLYPFSAGPMYWLCSSRSNELVGTKGRIFFVVYEPVIWGYQKGPEPIQGILRWYLGMWEK